MLTNSAWAIWRLGQALGCQLRDPQLAGGQRPGAGEPFAPRPAAGGDEFLAAPGGRAW